MRRRLDLPFSDEQLSRMWQRCKERVRAQSALVYRPGWERELFEASATIAEFKHMTENTKYNEQAEWLNSRYGASVR